MKAIELNTNEIGRIQVILSDYLNEQESGLIDLDRDFVLDDKTFVIIWIEGRYSIDQSFRQGQMQQRVEFECETFLVHDADDNEHPQECELLSFSDSETYFSQGNGYYI
jgi:hypothetical protein